MDVSVTQGDEITVSANVTNEGSVDDTKTVEFRVGNNVIADEEVSLNVSETETVTFENVSTASLDPGEYTHGVYTEDSNQTATLTVENSNDETSFQDVLVTIEEYNNGDADFQEVLQTIDDYNASN